MTAPVRESVNNVVASEEKGTRGIALLGAITAPAPTPLSDGADVGEAAPAGAPGATKGEVSYAVRCSLVSHRPRGSHSSIQKEGDPTYHLGPAYSLRIA